MLLCIFLEEPGSCPKAVLLFFDYSSLVSVGFSGSSVGKESTCNVGDLGLIPGLGTSLGEGKGYPLQDSDLENSIDWIVHGVAKSWTRLSDFHFTSLLFLYLLP